MIEKPNLAPDLQDELPNSQTQELIKAELDVLITSLDKFGAVERDEWSVRCSFANSAKSATVITSPTPDGSISVAFHENYDRHHDATFKSSDEAIQAIQDWGENTGDLFSDIEKISSLSGSLSRLMTLVMYADRPLNRQEILNWTKVIAGPESAQEALNKFVKKGLLIDQGDETYISSNEYPAKGLVGSAQKQDTYSEHYKSTVDEFLSKGYFE